MFSKNDLRTFESNIMLQIMIYAFNCALAHFYTLEDLFMNHIKFQKRFNDLIFDEWYLLRYIFKISIDIKMNWWYMKCNSWKLKNWYFNKKF